MSLVVLEVAAVEAQVQRGGEDQDHRQHLHGGGGAAPGPGGGGEGMQLSHCA